MYILRGMPGSGKTTWIKNHVKENYVNATDYVIASADHYHIDPDGTYHFDPKRLREAHQYAQNVALFGVKNGFDVFVDNTNIFLNHMYPYEDMALAYGYDVKVIRFVAPTNQTELEMVAERNQHGVPLEKCFQMAAQIEDYPGEELYTPVGWSS